MDNKIFLGKYRVAADEIEAAGEIADIPLEYEAEEIDSGKRVVVEVMPAASLKAAVRERLEAEAIAAKKISHPNIPALCDFGVENGHLVYITEDVEGTLVEEWVSAHGPMPVGPVLRIASQVVSALGAAAFHRINHHAINPSNLVLVPGQTAEGEWPLVKVLRFVGVAPKLAGTDVAVAAFDKSLHYASPEQIQNGTVDFRSELYSLGATMWFLLTGAPPPVASAAPTVSPVSRSEIAPEKIDGMPKTVRRLLSQMLAVDPEARPRDPLAFYRQLQDCLQQVERRETMARRFGIPALSPTGLPKRRRIPSRALALAALFLAIATVAALVVSGQLRHRRIVNAEEPIGKPIGIADASVTPVTANTNAIASNTAPPAADVVESKNVPTAPQLDAEPRPAIAPLPSAGPAAIASTRQVEMPPAPPAISDPSKDRLSQESVAVAAVSAGALPPDTGSRAFASNKQAEPTPGDSRPANAVAEETESKKVVMREVRRAEPADDEPEVRRAEPAPPEHAHESVLAEAARPDFEANVPEKSLAKQTNVLAEPKGPAEKKTKPAPPGEGPQIAEAEAASLDSEPSVPEKSPAKKTEREANPKREAEKRKTNSRQTMSRSDRAPRLRERSGRARLVGVTPEGWWMLETPSGRVIVVPPPPPSPR